MTKPLGQGAAVTLTLDDMESRMAIHQLRDAAQQMRDCRDIFDFLARTTAGNFAWDTDGYAVTAILKYSARAIAADLDEEPDGGGLWRDLTGLADRLKELKETADADE